MKFLLYLQPQSESLATSLSLPSVLGDCTVKVCIYDGDRCQASNVVCWRGINGHYLLTGLPFLQVEYELRKGMGRNAKEHILSVLNALKDSGVTVEVCTFVLIPLFLKHYFSLFLLVVASWLPLSTLAINLHPWNLRIHILLTSILAGNRGWGVFRGLQCQAWSKGDRERSKKAQTWSFGWSIVRCK